VVKLRHVQKTRNYHEVLSSYFLLAENMQSLFTYPLRLKN
jgi:hypothetical protein